MQKILAVLAMCFIVFGGFMMMGGQVMQIIKVVDIFIIFGAGITAMVISTEFSTIKLGLTQIKWAFSKGIHTQEYYEQLLSVIFELINVAKTQNIKALDQHVENPEESSIFERYPLIVADESTKNFIIDSFRLVIASKANAETSGNLATELEAEIDELSKQYLKPSEKFAAMGDSLPGIGILCAIMALVLVMGKLDADIYIIGSSIAGALVGTLTGIVGCYCIVLPIAGAAETEAKKQIQPLLVVRSSILQYVRGVSPHISVNAGRKHVPIKFKPTFTELEERVKALTEIQTQSL
ncbi:motility-associated protein [Vibrio owensii]|uniref:motility-associated protein n=1 Tax=Vibrio owensii TaxID=696485 RepID=UPI0018F25FA0|nr:motility-associated protein [Vibrio owensii]